MAQVGLMIAIPEKLISNNTLTVKLNAKWCLLTRKSRGISQGLLQLLFCSMQHSTHAHIPLDCHLFGENLLILGRETFLQAIYKL